MDLEGGRGCRRRGRGDGGRGNASAMEDMMGDGPEMGLEEGSQRNE